MQIISLYIFLPAGAGSGSVLVRQFPHLHSAAKLADADRGTNSRKQLIEQYSLCHKLPEPVHNRLPVQDTAAEYWQQKLVANPQCAAVPLVHMAQDVISAPASQAFVKRLFQFMVC